jgi:hypothetical protein
MYEGIGFSGTAGDWANKLKNISNNADLIDVAGSRLGGRTTIKDIASEAGVSTATVSRVLNNPELVSPAKRDAVRTAMARHDYVLHGMAGALAGARSMTIGLVIPTITNSIYAASTHAIQRVAQQQNYSVLLGVSDFEPPTEDSLIRRLIERRVDGLILTGGIRDPRDIPTYCAPWHSVRSDMAAGGRAARALHRVRQLRRGSLGHAAPDRSRPQAHRPDLRPDRCQ